MTLVELFSIQIISLGKSDCGLIKSSGELDCRYLVDDREVEEILLARFFGMGAFWFELCGDR